MSEHDDLRPVELHIFSHQENHDIVEILTAVAHFHRRGATLGVGHTVNFGKAWFQKSQCEFGLVSLPYLDGPTLEVLPPEDGGVVKFYWLIPITESEVVYKKRRGLEALESEMERSQFNYLDPYRTSIC